MALNVEQPKWVPAFTATGFTKEKIPEDLYAAILEKYRRAVPHMRVATTTEQTVQEEDTVLTGLILQQVEPCDGSVINCRTIKSSQDEECQFSDIKRTFMIDIGSD